MDGTFHLRVHDLLWIGNASELGSTSRPDWVQDALAARPVVVVRRAVAPQGFLPVGVRGTNRSQRYATILPTKEVLCCKTPESLAAEASWHSTITTLSPRMIEALELIREAARTIGLSWGPIGSVGFQLATGVPSTNSDSDLDIQVRCTDSLTPADIHHFSLTTYDAPVRVDTVLEAECGAVSLGDYLQNPLVMVKTVAGPRVAHFAW